MTPEELSLGIQSLCSQLIYHLLQEDFSDTLGQRSAHSVLHHIYPTIAFIPRSVTIFAFFPLPHILHHDNHLFTSLFLDYKFPEGKVIAIILVSLVSDTYLYIGAKYISVEHSSEKKFMPSIPQDGTISRGFPQRRKMNYGY